VPSTVASLLAATGLKPGRRVAWGEPVPEPRTGVYVFPKVLILVPTEPRRSALVEVAGDQPADSWPLFQDFRLRDYDAFDRAVPRCCLAIKQHAPGPLGGRQLHGATIEKQQCG